MSDNIANTQALPAGTRLEEFVIERVLGSGGFGITYLARDVSLNRQVVIKENLPAQFAWRETASGTVRPRHTSGGDADDYQWAMNNFLREAEMLASLDHPGIVRVLRKFEANGTAYFVMPYLDGVALDELIKERHANDEWFAEVELVGLLTRLLPALDYLHARGIYHRDIKPGNILITNEGVPALIDFGSARQRLSERSMTVVESAGYTPFEQLQSRGEIGPWSDLYALGATMVKAITGEAPPKAADRVMGDPWKCLSEDARWAAAYSAPFLQAIDKALSVKPAERWQSGDQWLDGMNASSSAANLAGAMHAAGKKSPASTHFGRGAVTATQHDSIHWEDEDADPVTTHLEPSRKLSKSTRQTLIAGVCGVAVVGLVLLAIRNTGNDAKPVRAEMHEQETSPPSAAEVEPAEWRKMDEAAIQNEREKAEAAEAKPKLSSEFQAKQIGAVANVPLAGKALMPFAYCPAGSFTMGSPASENGHSSDENQVRVTLTKGFWLAKTEVTQAQWQAVMGRNPSRFEGDNLPVVNVSWDEAREFISKVNASGVLPAGWKMALPTEAQWEYACRAGASGPYSGGTIDEVAWYEENSGSKTHEVGTKKPNAWGLHDMHGNVWEWCADWYGDELPGGTDPTGASLGVARVNRGGSWLDNAAHCRAANRLRHDPGNRGYYLGFRPALVPSE